MREVSNPASLIYMLDADDAAMIVKALGDLSIKLEDGGSDKDAVRAWDIRQAVKAARDGNATVRIEVEA
jgi:hypothetical protein